MASENPDPGAAYSEVFEEGTEAGQERNIHRIRANSSIMQLKKILVANRGEIPIRIFRTAHELSLQTVAVFSYEDRLSMHRQKADEAYVIGKRGQYTPVGAYLAGDEIIKIAVQHGVQMIHPGYGFLSENAEFAKNVEKAGLIFVGPSPEVINALGDKVSARALAIKANVPVVPGTEGAVEKFEEVKKFTDEYGFPIIIKAAYGGGGRGMRVVREQKDLEDAFQRATSEAKSAFGNGTVFVERFLDKPKHIEVQLLGDNQGNIVHLFERDCSVQRRHQKVVELAPAKDLPVEVRDRILADAVKLAKSVNYRNAGTAEFLVDQQNRYYFIEINPRIQVEHTITEEITGIDIIAAQIQIAAGATLAQLGLTQDRISTRGFAIQCRITTEDPSKGFSPDTGKIEVYRSAGGNGVRLDGGNGFAGAIITQHHQLIMDSAITESATNMAEYILWLVWSLLVLTPEHLKNPAIALILTSQDVVEEVMSVFSFAPSLWDAVQDASQPSLAFFKSLPTTCKNLWGVYLLVLEKDGHRPMIYVGSGTDSTYGILRRFLQYDARQSLPSRIGPALDNGYTITHKGVLCWTPRPAAVDKYNIRGLILAMETAFAVLFWAMEFKTKDYGLPKHLCPWDIGTTDYYGLCSHAAFTEGIRGENDNLNDLEIEEREAAILQRQSDMKKARYYGAKNRDYDAWKAVRRGYEAKRDLHEKRESGHRSRLKAKAEGRFKCNLCDLPFESQYLLTMHNATISHINKSKGIAKKAPKVPGYSVWADRNKALKKHYCKFCDHNTSTKQKLDSHFKSSKHKAKVLAAKAEKSSS